MAGIVLNLGCGPPGAGRLPGFFQSEPGWREVRVDIERRYRPDIVASLTDLAVFGNGSVQAVWCSHALEHVHSFEVADVLAGCHRILDDQGVLLLTLPDLQRVAALVAEDKLHDAAYQSGLGAITALDMLFGHQSSIAAGRTHMAHRTGFTARSLGKALIEAGFARAKVKRGKLYDLWAVAYRMVPEAMTRRYPDL